MNPRTRRAALYAIGVIAILASVNALAHSYAGLYGWAAHHRLAGWQAMSWPAEIDVFLAIGELALYVAYLDGWPARQRIWPWTTALIGLAVSIAGNIGHIQAEPGHPVILADRLTAATSPIAAFAGLTVGLLVLKMTRQQTAGHGAEAVAAPARQHWPRAAVSPPPGPLAGTVLNGAGGRPEPMPSAADGGGSPRARPGPGSGGPGRGILHDATVLYQTAAANGERLSQRTLASQLRRHGHRFSNQHLHAIAASIGLSSQKAA
jgi:hypothetical protein